MDIKDFRLYCTDDTLQITSHALLRCRERGIKLDEIESCIINGEIIEEYPDDYPFPSALICGNQRGNPLHVIAGMGEGQIWVITAYYPDPKKWNNDFKTRRES